MEATKVSRLLRLKFIKGIEEGLAEITPQQIEDWRPTEPVPKGAVIVGALPEEFKAFLVLTRILEASRSSAANDCDAEEARGHATRYDSLRARTDLAKTADDLFWTCVRVELPPPSELAYEQGLASAVGPNYEVYYRTLSAEEIAEAVTSQRTVRVNEGSHILH